LKTYKAKVIAGEDGWLVAEVAGLRAFSGAKAGVVTQGRDLDELGFMIRDAVESLTDQTDFAIQMTVPAAVLVRSRRRALLTKATRTRAA